MDLSLFYLPTWRPGFGGDLNAYFDELIESVRLADRLGWRRALTSEHHFHYYGGAVPNPAVMLAAWARETGQIRVGPAVSLVPLRHPLQVAEDYALVDHLAKGRFDMGVSRGFVPHEFDAFGVDRAETAERVAEGLEIIERFWTGEPFEHRGRFWRFDTIEPWPRPYQKTVPIWIAASNSRESFERAGSKGYHLMTNHYPMSRAALFEKFGWYRDAHAAAGHDPDSRKAMVAFMACIAETEEIALKRAKGAMQEHAGTFGKLMRGEQWDRDYAAGEEVFTRMLGDGDVLAFFRERTLICSPEQAAERIAQYLEQGFTEISLTSRFAGLAAAHDRETIQRMSEEVLPMLGVSRAAQ